MLLAWPFSEYMQITVEATDRRFRCCGVVLQGGGPFVEEVATVTVPPYREKGDDGEVGWVR
jgi:hypothetical protein